MNLCSKPGCGHAGAVILGYEYSQRRIVLEDPEGGEISPHAYVMCTSCTEKLTPPRGWEVEDHRSSPPLFLDGVAYLELVEPTPSRSPSRSPWGGSCSSGPVPSRSFPRPPHLGTLLPKTLVSPETAMPFDRRLIQQLRALDRHDLRRVLIFVRGLLLSQGDDFGGEAVPEDPESGVTYRLEGVKCGKPACNSCPHGPYWYAYYREGDRLRSRYIGRNLPDEVTVPARD